MIYDYEKRKDKRLDLSLPIQAKRAREGPEAPFRGGVTRNVSVGGVCFEVSSWREIKLGDVVTISISVPREFSHIFPFSRLAGKARVVRIEEMAPDEFYEAERQGIALEFGSDFVMLRVA